MQIVDANVLLYATNLRAHDHRASRRQWLDEALGGDARVGFAWVVLLTFLRLSTSPTVFPRPLSVDQASQDVQGWLEQPAAVLVEPAARYLALLGGLLAKVGTAGGLVDDVHLAALSLEHGAEIVSFDRHFGRFEGVRWRMPA